MNLSHKSIKTPGEGSPGLKDVLVKYYPWLVISFCAFFLFYKYILQVSPSVMTQELMSYFNVGGVGLGNLAAAYFYTYLVVQIFAGPLLDKYSPRLLMMGAVFISAIGIFEFSRASTLSHALFSRGLIGAGAAFATVGYLKMAAVWFKPRQFAFVAGLLATAAMIGSMAGQVPLALMVGHFGWQKSLMYIGFFGFLLSLAFFIFVRDNKEKPVAIRLEKATHHLKWRDFLEVLKHKHNWLLMFYGGFSFSPVAVFGGLWGNPFLEEAYHITRTQAATLTSMIFLGLAVGAPIFGFVSDRLGERYKMMFFGLFLSFMGILPALYMSHLPAWVVGACLFIFGFGTGAYMLVFTLGKEMNHILLAATVIALINTGDGILGAFTEPFIGKVLDFFWRGKIVDGVHYFTVHDFHFALSLLPLYIVGASFFLFLLVKLK